MHGVSVGTKAFLFRFVARCFSDCCDSSLTEELCSSSHSPTRERLGGWNGTLIHREGRGLMIRARQWLTVDMAGSPAAELAARRLAERVYAPVITAFAPPATLKNEQHSYAGTAMAPQISLLTMEPRPDGSAFIRLAHKHGAHETGSPATVDLTTLLAKRARTAVEHSLNGLTASANARTRLVWKVAGESQMRSNTTTPAWEPTGPGLTVELSPMEVRAFVLTF